MPKLRRQSDPFERLVITGAIYQGMLNQLTCFPFAITEKVCPFADDERKSAFMFGANYVLMASAAYNKMLDAKENKQNDKN